MVEDNVKGTLHNTYYYNIRSDPCYITWTKGNHRRLTTAL